MASSILNVRKLISPLLFHLSLREKFEKETRKGKNRNKVADIVGTQNVTAINEMVHQRLERQFDIIYPGTSCLFVYFD
jgi:hypothetical protein